MVTSWKIFCPKVPPFVKLRNVTGDVQTIAVALKIFPDHFNLICCAPLSTLYTIFHNCYSLLCRLPQQTAWLQSDLLCSTFATPPPFFFLSLFGHRRIKPPPLVNTIQNVGFLVGFATSVKKCFFLLSVLHYCRFLGLYNDIHKAQNRKHNAYKYSNSCLYTIYI